MSSQFSSVAQSCPTLFDPMNRSMPGLPVHHQLPEFPPTHIHRVSDAIQPSHKTNVTISRPWALLLTLSDLWFNRRGKVTPTWPWSNALC